MIGSIDVQSTWRWRLPAVEVVVINNWEQPANQLTKKLHTYEDRYAEREAAGVTSDRVPEALPIVTLILAVQQTGPEQEQEKVVRCIKSTV